jgi:putative ATP-dependent endonuclease of OLD family
MFIRTITVANFRSLNGLALDIEPAGIVLTGPNGAGKTSLLIAVAAALGRPVAIGPEDFVDLVQPIEIRVVLGGIRPADQQVFGDKVTFGGTGGSAQLTVGMLATWDADRERVDARCAFPTSSWSVLTRAQRESLPVVWLPASRDAHRLLAVAGHASVLALLLERLDMDEAKKAALALLGDAIAELTSSADLVSALQQLALQLGRLIPDVGTAAYSLGAASEHDLWSTLRLAVEHGGPRVGVADASSGLGHLSIFAVLLQLLASEPRIVLVDEPEISLHPSAQRAVVRRLGAASSQLILATHSSSVLDRVDVRQIARLQPIGTNVAVHRPTGVSDIDARRYGRIIDPRASEAVFAKTLVVVEGPSDRLALFEVAAILDIDLDALGIVVLALDGAMWIKLATLVYGPPGLSVPLRGLVDADHEGKWQSALTAVGLAAASRQDLKNHGFFVCDPDLEPVLVDALGVPTVEQVIANDGATSELQLLAQQPSYANASRRDQIVAFVKKDKTRWAPLMAARLTITSQTPLHDLLGTL